MEHLLLRVALLTGIALVSLDLSSMQFPIVEFRRSRLVLGLLCRLGVLCGDSCVVFSGRYILLKLHTLEHLGVSIMPALNDLLLFVPKVHDSPVGNAQVTALRRKSRQLKW